MDPKATADTFEKFRVEKGSFLSLTSNGGDATECLRTLANTKATNSCHLLDLWTPTLKRQMRGREETKRHGRGGREKDKKRRTGKERERERDRERATESETEGVVGVHRILSA